MNIDKLIWPGYIAPEKNEIFSSWFIRLCCEHKIKSHSFSKYYLNNIPIWNRDIDLYCPEFLVQKIKEHTILSDIQIRDLFLNSYQDLLFNKNKDRLFTINQLGVIHRKRKLNGLRYCPGCLGEEKIFFRKNWRLSTSLICTKCKLMLLDCCPTCRSPICFYRLETGNKSSLLEFPLNKCWNCKTNLHLEHFKIPANNLLLEYQTYIDNTLNNGYNDKTQYSFQYFYMLISLQKKIITKSHGWSRIKNAAISEFGSIFYNIDFESKDLSLLTNSLLASYLILQKSPLSFSTFCADYNLRSSDFTKDLDNIPFWFIKTFRNSY
ncbi:TniQ family protein [Flavobacterium sharifuzzamanii]|uniref:TniQ family protein n=1 Tax=Flavobacterium sharifuzzamanii TaxID=2211133 RepID=UPI000DACE0E4|nr:TniQ family protein [Flavobacterium sharifuzzamanii]KAF2082004.1 TniQ family protein [Flavobacterium sharifuzzamanii]